MIFKTEEEAWEYWLESYYRYDGYEPPGRNFDDKVDMFHDWTEEANVTWEEDSNVFPDYP